MTDIRRDMLRITIKRRDRLALQAKRQFGKDSSSWPRSIRERLSTLKHKASELQEAMGR